MGLADLIVDGAEWRYLYYWVVDKATWTTTYYPVTAFSPDRAKYEVSGSFDSRSEMEDAVREVIAAV